VCIFDVPLVQRLGSVCPFTSENGPRFSEKKGFVALPVLIITLGTAGLPK
jgi:hypothetical protein